MLIYTVTLTSLSLTNIARFYYYWKNIESSFLYLAAQLYIYMLGTFIIVVGK